MGFPKLIVEQGETLVPLNLLRECCVPEDLVQANVSQTLQRPYRRFNELMSVEDMGTLSIVGSGPSIHKTIQEVEGTVLSCNAAHEFLVRRGTPPDYAMFWDAAEVVASMFTPQHGVTYLIASRCHPKVFERLQGYDVVVWHAGGEDMIERLEEIGRNEPVVHGGSAAVVRAMFVGAAMGHRRLKLFGVDGSFEGEHTHFQKSAVPEKEIRVCCNHKWFRTTAWLAAQAEEIPLLFPILEGLGVKIEVYGDGLVPHVAKTLGYDVKGLEELLKHKPETVPFHATTMWDDIEIEYQKATQ